MANIYHKSTDYVSYVDCDGTAMIQPWTSTVSGETTNNFKKEIKQWHII